MKDNDFFYNLNQSESTAKIAQWLSDTAYKLINGSNGDLFIDINEYYCHSESSLYVIKKKTLVLTSRTNPKQHYVVFAAKNYFSDRHKNVVGYVMAEEQNHQTLKFKDSDINVVGEYWVGYRQGSRNTMVVLFSEEEYKTLEKKILARKEFNRWKKLQVVYTTHMSHTNIIGAKQNAVLEKVRTANHIKTFVTNRNGNTKILDIDVNVATGKLHVAEYPHSWHLDRKKA